MTQPVDAGCEGGQGDVAERPRLLTPSQLCTLYPIKRRTLKYWIQQSVDRQVSLNGKAGVLPGNGLAAALVRKGRLIFIDEDLFLRWLYERSGGG